MVGLSIEIPAVGKRAAEAMQLAGEERSVVGIGACGREDRPAVGVDGDQQRGAVLLDAHAKRRQEREAGRALESLGGVVGAREIFVQRFGALEFAFASR